jgi:hypothetical protein
VTDEEVVYLLAALERDLAARLAIAGVPADDIPHEMRALVDAVTLSGEPALLARQSTNV